MKRLCTCLAVLSFVVPLLFIAVAAYMSGWFNLFNNALSDLGHAHRATAPIFNFGLALGSFLLTSFALLYAYRSSRLVAVLLAVSAFSLNLVAVFDEVYGRLHFWVSAAFFLSLAALLVGYSYIEKRIAPFAALAVGIAVASWILHFAYRVPRGAAIPELISVFVSAPFLIHFALRKACREGAASTSSSVKD